MARAFVPDPQRDGALVGRMEPVEIELVTELLTQTCELLIAREGDEGVAPSASAVSSDGRASSSGVPGESQERDLFASLSASMEARPAPSDPALRRLLPDGASRTPSPDDPTAFVQDDELEEESQEFRRLTEDTIRAQKERHLGMAVEAFGRYLDGATPRELVLTRAEARASMMALTDARLVLAERLGIHTEDDAEELHELVETLDAPRNARELTAMYYDFITWLSESLTVAYMGRA